MAATITVPATAPAVYVDPFQKPMDFLALSGTNVRLLNVCLDPATFS